MTRLLFPGRHHLLTNFQLDYLRHVIDRDGGPLGDVNGQPLQLASPIDTIIWAITSANHANTRRNPLPAHRREVAIEELADLLDAESFVYLIDDIGTSPRFAEYVVKRIEVDSRGRFRLTPQDTVVGCSTMEVIEQYERLGFRILPFELADRRRRTFSALPPAMLLDQIVERALAGADWRSDELFRTQVARASQRLYFRYHYGDLLLDLYRHPLLTADGELTATRNYNVYVRAFDESAARKFNLVKDAIRPGRIVDIGCCTGAVLREISHDDRFRESDLYGIEVARPLYAECLHRKAQGAFGNDNVFFYQQDFCAGTILPDNSVDTFTTFSLTHEVESYAGREALRQLIGLLHRQLALGGRWINLDVVGPAEKDRPVLLWLNRDDGRTDDWDRSFGAEEREALRDYLAGLSTFGRFLRFARDFRREEGQSLQYEVETLAGTPYIALRLRDACEFLSKKDYLDNWQSEMQETFCFWSFDDWAAAVEPAGFRVLPGSTAFVNPWIIENRYQGKAELFAKDDDSSATAPALRRLEYPPTNILLVAEKQMGQAS